MRNGETMTADDVLGFMISRSVCVTPYAYIFSVPYMAQEFGITKYRARKYINELKERGLVRSTCESGYDDYYERWYILRGYVLTKAAKELPEYIEAERKEMEYLNDLIHKEEDYD